MMAGEAAMARIAHFLKQFFAGVGGEEKANLPVGWREGPVGPGRRLQEILGPGATIAATVWAGDNYVAEHAEEARARLQGVLGELRLDVVVAGPAFDAGRYGVACAEVCDVARALGIPAVTAMHPDNPGAAFYRETLVVPTTADVAGMDVALQRIARLALKLGRSSGARHPCPRRRRSWVRRVFRDR